MIKYSWILPVRNEAQSLPQLIAEITQTMRGLPAGRQGKKYEIIAVNDASSDTTLTTLAFLMSPAPQSKIINFKLHQGKWAALQTGFEEAKGQIIITLDSDLQDNPREVRKLLNKLSRGYDLVSGLRSRRRDLLYKVWLSKLGNFLLASLTGIRFRDANSSFKVYKRQVIEAIPKHGSLFRFSMLFAQKLGYKVVEVPITHRPRLFGKSKFGIVKYLRIIYDLILVLLLFSGSGRISKK